MGRDVRGKTIRERSPPPKLGSGGSRQRWQPGAGEGAEPRGTGPSASLPLCFPGVCWIRAGRWAAGLCGQGHSVVSRLKNCSTRLSFRPPASPLLLCFPLLASRWHLPEHMAAGPGAAVGCMGSQGQPICRAPPALQERSGTEVAFLSLFYAEFRAPPSRSSPAPWFTSGASASGAGAPGRWGPRRPALPGTS